ncbi:MAG TPA: fibronectin type III domain-containing protein, partial [Bacteroidota bacterium]|nr:fibronectin type III domain-containing protein [Bacteroidota bacterium]
MKNHRSVVLMMLVLMSVGVALSQAPLPPTNLTLQPGMHGGVMLRWDSSANALGYKVFKAVDTSNFFRVAVVLRPGYFDWAIFPNQTYHYYVKASNLSGDSSPSDTVSYTLGPPPP